MKHFNNLNSSIFLGFILLILTYINIYSQEVTIEKYGNANKINLYHGNRIVSTFPAQFGNENIVNPGNQETTNDNISSFNWVLKFTAGNKVFKDISFANNL